MANTKLVFVSTPSSTYESELQCFCTEDNDIHIQIDGDGFEFILLDKETAVKLTRTLKSEISKMTW